ncbi:MAG: DUF58 domain-containing protein [Candidatus Bipolaricaulota bacterium]|nr:MAG: DUF58 domain-containing protein [Candidatus Bipolaricaulota bacterium]
MTEALIDTEFLERLANLRFIVRGRWKGRLSGVHASRRAGVSLEFADYREYCPGDDLRYVDWNIYGRLDRVLVKSFVHEVDLPVTLLVDCSASMSLGQPSKLRYAGRLCAALSYLGLNGLERVGVYPFAERLLPGIPPRHGMRQMGHVLRLLQGLSAERPTAMDEALAQYVAHSHESGLVFVIGDLLTDRGYEEGISRLRVRGDRVVVVQLLAREELDPALEGSVRITEAESAQHLELDIGRRTLAQYRQRLDAELSRLESFLAGLQIPYFLVPTDAPLEELLYRRFRAQGVLQ